MLCGDAFTSKDNERKQIIPLQILQMHFVFWMLD